MEHFCGTLGRYDKILKLNLFEILGVNKDEIKYIKMFGDFQPICQCLSVFCSASIAIR